MVLRCLLVDDNAGFLKAARGLLHGNGVDVVGVASSSEEAVDGARRLRPDVALVDIALGEESGFDLARRLTDAPGLERLRVILISTYAEGDFTDLIAASAAVGFLSKSELSASAIVEILERRGE